MSKVLIGDDYNTHAFEDAVESLNRATQRFVDGDNDLWKALCSHASDVSIAGRAGGFDRGWDTVGDRYDWVRDQYVHGDVSCETINSYVSGDLGFTLQVVRGTVLLKGKAAPEHVEVRVTHILRREEECWRLLHRHADNAIARRPLAGEISLGTESDVEAVARDWAVAAWNRHDLDAAATFLAPEWVGHYAGLGEARGRDGFKGVATEFTHAFPDMQISVEDALSQGDKVVRRVSWTATHAGTFLGIPPTGKRVVVRETIILRIADGRIAEEWQMGNMLGLLQQLGVAPVFSLDCANPGAPRSAYKD